MPLENEQFGSINSPESLRRELEDKIEKRLSKDMAYLLVVIVGAILGYAFVQIGTVNSKMEDLSKRVTIIETKIDDAKNGKK